ncbi:methyltransferase [Flexivirga endophytica]|uniref:Methyltransferase n=1 Tax=Flexivirga endophytica TaxID=1849103 RepID=A0A916STL6_9MICO|nr:class I SAM-dependent methyltransferase [Flexivirga endophytica]GGB17411.1 methyltransferase [Flexivirga endophytica]GHB38203.1 methyltransferase [Flexivirga endophytica]
MTTQIDKESALGWLRRWDDQQATYFVDREERFEVIVDVVEAAVGRPDPLVVDLGVGPGSLAHRLLQRLPAATVVGVDMDPLLLGLAESAYGSDGFSVVQKNLTERGWCGRLGLDRAPDAFVSTTALHWLGADDFAAVADEAIRHLAPGGVFVDGDHFYEPEHTPRLDAVRRDVAAGAACRAGRVDAEDWGAWWDAVAEAPELRALVQRRAAEQLQTSEDRRRQRVASLSDVRRALQDAGCAEVGTAWQNGDDFVVVGLL